jgi:coenzyme F420-reducing hydrogenase delta subunit
MTALAAAPVDDKARIAAPRILVFSTNNISDPGIDLAGSAHLHYSPGVMVISMPCTSGIRPSWILHAIKQGFDGVFIASDGDECAYLPDCAERASRIMAEAQTLLKAEGFAAAPEDGGHLLGLRRELRQAHDQFSEGADRARPSRGAKPWTTTRSSSAAASPAWSRPSSSATWATRSCSSRRRPASAAG